MSSKYLWVFFNLMASLLVAGVIVSLMSGFGGTEIVEEHGEEAVNEIGVLLLAGLVSSGFWFFRTIRLWKACLMADDPAFRAALEKLDE